MPEDLKLSVRVGPGDTFEWSQVLLAKAHPDGTLELLTAEWGRLLGYGRQEFEEKTFCQLMGSTQSAATAAVAAILDPRNMAPVDLEVRCRDGQRMRLRLHRRFDAYSRKMYIVADETAGSAANCSAP